MNPLSSIANPTMAALLKAWGDQLQAQFNCHRVGTVVSFDPDKQTASVRINDKATIYNQTQTSDSALAETPNTVDYPLLVDVPVLVIRGGGASLRMPISTGDNCLVCFNDRDLDAWFSSGTVLPPNSPRMHHLSDGIAIIGLSSAANPITGYSADDAGIVYGASSLIIQKDGTIVLTGTTGKTIQMTANDATVTISAAGQIQAIGKNGSTLTLETTGRASISKGTGYVSVKADGTVEAFGTGSSFVILGSKASVGNSSMTLLSSMQYLSAALTALDAKTGPSAAAAITTFNNSYTSFLA